MAKLHYANKLATCCATSPMNSLGADFARAQHHDIASAQQVGQQVGSVEFISQQVVQQVRMWCTRHELAGQQVGNLFDNLFVKWSLGITKQEKEKKVFIRQPASQPASSVLTRPSM
jgi:hypothetical protein